MVFKKKTTYLLGNYLSTLGAALFPAANPDGDDDDDERGEEKTGGHGISLTHSGDAIDAKWKYRWFAQIIHLRCPRPSPQVGTSSIASASPMKAKEQSRPIKDDLERLERLAELARMTPRQVKRELERVRSRLH